MTAGRAAGFTGGSMLAVHQRAAWVQNNPEIQWHHFLQSRFVGLLPDRGRDASLAIVVQAVAQQSENHADLRGVTEYAVGASLPVVMEFTGSLMLDTREISVQEQQLNQPGRIYSGQFSENGRVIAMRFHPPGGKASKVFHLIHEETLAMLTGDGG